MLSIEKVIEFTTDGLNIQNLLNTLLCLSLKKPSYFSWEFQESLKKHYCADLVIPCLLYVNLNYSVNILPSYHSIYIFNCCSHVSTFKNHFLFQFKTRRTLFTSFTYVWTSILGCLAGMMQLHVKILFLEVRFFICKSEISFVKIFP